MLIVLEYSEWEKYCTKPHCMPFKKEFMLFAKDCNTFFALLSFWKTGMSTGKNPAAVFHKYPKRFEVKESERSHILIASVCNGKVQHYNATSMGNLSPYVSLPVTSSQSPWSSMTSFSKRITVYLFASDYTLASWEKVFGNTEP